MFRLASTAFGNYKYIAGIGAAEKAVVSNIKALNFNDKTLSNHSAGKLATVAQFYTHSGDELFQEIINVSLLPPRVAILESGPLIACSQGKISFS
jgi:hypothetical protein